MGISGGSTMILHTFKLLEEMFSQFWNFCSIFLKLQRKMLCFFIFMTHTVAMLYTVVCCMLNVVCQDKISSFHGRTVSATIGVVLLPQPHSYSWSEKRLPSFNVKYVIIARMRYGFACKGSRHRRDSI